MNFSLKTRHFHSHALPGIFVSALLMGTGSLHADKLEMKDGRIFEGRLLDSDAVDATRESVRIDAMVAGIRVTLRLKKDQVAKIERKEVPETFYQTARPQTPERDATQPRHAPGTTVYLDIPIHGEFGKTVHLEGLARALVYASRNRIEHVVFTLNSTGGDPGLAYELDQLLEHYDRRMRFHAMVEHASGDALLFLLRCDSIHVKNNAVIGKTGNPSSLNTVRVTETAYTHGLPGDVLGALTDPAGTLAIWRTPEGQTYAAPQLPEGIPENQVLLRDNDQTLLTLDSKLAKAISLARGTVENTADIGPSLLLKNWTTDGDFGIRAMREAVEIASRSRQQTSPAQADYETQMRQVLTRRQAAKITIADAMTEAHHWDPNRGRYTQRQNWLDPNLTPSAKSLWQDRSDLAIRALQKAKKSLAEMKQLETDATRLGLDPVMTEHELQVLSDRIEAELKILVKYRERRSL